MKNVWMQNANMPLAASRIENANARGVPRITY
jgi:hypothetical protein